MEAASTFETSVSFYQSTWRYNPEDSHLHVSFIIRMSCLQIAGVLGAGSSVLKPELIKLLRDDAEEVLQGLVPHLGQTLLLLSKAGAFSPDVMVSSNKGT
jgi:hypothetical protein